MSDLFVTQKVVDRTIKPAISFATPSSYNQYIPEAGASTIEEAFQKDISFNPLGTLESTLRRAEATLKLMQSDGEEGIDDFTIGHLSVMDAIEAVLGYIQVSKTSVEYLQAGNRAYTKNLHLTYQAIYDKLKKSWPGTAKFYSAITPLMTFDTELGQEARELYGTCRKDEEFKILLMNLIENHAPVKEKQEVQS